MQSKPSQQSLEALENLPQTIAGLTKSLKGAQDALEQKQTDLSSTTAKVKVKNEELDKVEKRLQERRDEAALFEKQFAERKEAAENELKGILKRTTDTAKTLKGLTEQADEIKRDLAARTLAVEKREEVNSRKERALRDAEGKVEELHNYMKL